MELHSKLAIIRALQNTPGLSTQLLKDKTRDEGIKLLSEGSNLSENFINIHFNQVKLIVFAQGL